MAFDLIQELQGMRAAGTFKAGLSDALLSSCSLYGVFYSSFKKNWYFWCAFEIFFCVNLSCIFCSVVRVWTDIARGGACA